MIGAGVIGSLFAGHLAEVAEVSLLTRRPRARGRAQRRRAPHHGAQRPARPRVTATADPDELEPFDLGIVATKAGGLEAAAARSRAASRRRRSMPVLNGLGAERGDPRARRLADRLVGHVHQRHEALRHARSSTSSTPRRGSGRTRTRRTSACEEIADLIVASGLKAEALPGSAPGAVVEADLQRDRQLRRRRSPSSATTRTSRPRRARPTSVISSTT